MREIISDKNEQTSLSRAVVLTGAQLVLCTGKRENCIWICVNGPSKAVGGVVMVGSFLTISVCCDLLVLL